MHNYISYSTDKSEQMDGWTDAQTHAQKNAHTDARMHIHESDTTPMSRSSQAG